MRFILLAFLCWYIVTASESDADDGRLQIAEQNEELDAHYEMPVQEEDADHSELLEREDTLESSSQLYDDNERLEDQSHQEEDQEFDGREEFPNPERSEDEEEVDDRSELTEVYEDSTFETASEATTASSRSIATVMIHHERSSESKIEATVNAFDHTHHLILEKKTELAPQMQRLVVTENGTVEVEGNPSQSSNITYYEDPVNGALLYMNADNTLEGMLSEDISLRYENNQHLASKINEAHMKNLQSIYKRLEEKNKFESEGDKTNEFMNVKIVEGPIPGYSDRNQSGNETFFPFDYRMKEESMDDSSSDDLEFHEKSSERGITEKKGRRRRQSWKRQCQGRERPNFYVEVLAVVDSVLANQIGEKEYIKVYTALYWKLVALRFLTLPGMAVHVRLVGFLVSPSTSTDRFLLASYNRRYANKRTSVRRFSRFMASRRRYFRRHDIAVLMTGRDLGVFRNRHFYVCPKFGRPAGSRPCLVTRRNAFNTAVFEDDGFYTGLRTASKVVAMILGASADGRGKNRACPARHGFLMSGRYYSVNNFRFSKCSAASIKKTYCRRYNRCLRKAKLRFHIRSNWGYFPGLHITLKEQCYRRFNNRKLRPYRANWRQCVRLHCFMKSTCGTRIYYVSRYPALAGTRIGNKFCYHGRTIRNKYWLRI